MVDEISTGKVVHPSEQTQSTDVLPSSEITEVKDVKQEELSEKSLQVLQRMEKSFDSLTNSLKRNNVLMQETLKFHQDTFEKQERDKLREFDQQQEDELRNRPSQEPDIDDKKAKSWFSELLGQTKSGIGGIGNFFGSLFGVAGGLLSGKAGMMGMAGMGGLALALVPSLREYLIRFTKQTLKNIGIPPEAVEKMFEFLEWMSSNIIDGLKWAWKNGWNFLVWAEDIRQKIIDVTAKLLDTITKDAVAAYNWTVDTAVAAWDWTTGLAETIGNMLNTVSQKILAGIDAISAGAEEIWKQVKEDGLFQTMFSYGGKLWKSITGLAVGIGSALVDWFNGETDKAKKMRERLFSDVEDFEFLTNAGIGLGKYERERLEEAKSDAESVLADPDKHTAEEIAAAESMLGRVTDIERKSAELDKKIGSAESFKFNDAARNELRHTLNTIKQFVPPGGELSDQDVKDILHATMELLDKHGIDPTQENVLNTIRQVDAHLFDMIKNRPSNLDGLEKVFKELGLEPTFTGADKKPFVSDSLNNPSAFEQGKNDISSYLDKIDKAGSSKGKTVVIPQGGGQSVVMNSNQVGGSNMTVYSTTVVGSHDLNPGYPSYFGK